MRCPRTETLLMSVCSRYSSTHVKSFQPGTKWEQSLELPLIFWFGSRFKPYRYKVHASSSKCLPRMLEEKQHLERRVERDMKCHTKCWLVFSFFSANIHFVHFQSQDRLKWINPSFCGRLNGCAGWGIQVSRLIPVSWKCPWLWTSWRSSSV